MTESVVAESRKRNAFEVVTLAAARSKQLLRGCLPKLEGSPKLARRALQEVIAGLVSKVDPPVE